MRALFVEVCVAVRELCIWRRSVAARSLCVFVSLVLKGGVDLPRVRAASDARGTDAGDEGEAN